MKTNFGILGLTVVLLCSCQNKSENEERIELDSIEISNMDQLTLENWLSFKRESDSILSSAELAIEKRGISNGWLSTG